MHAFVTASGVVERGAFVYAQVAEMATEYLQIKAERAPSTDAEFLRFIDETQRDFLEKARRLHNLLLYLNRHYVRREREYGDKSVVDVFEQQRNLFEGKFLFDIRRAVQQSAFKYILNGAPLNCTELRSPVVRAVVISPGRYNEAHMSEFHGSRRPVYLVTRKLQQSACTSRLSAQSQPGPAVHLLQHNPSAFSTLTALVEHWAVLVGPVHGYQEGSNFSSCTSPGAVDGTANHVLLWELVINDKNKSIDYRHATLDASSLKELSSWPLQGYTLCSDENIHEFGKWSHCLSSCPSEKALKTSSFCMLLRLFFFSFSNPAKQVISSMATFYNPVRNNCQLFCHKLLRCIMTPTTLEELQNDYPNIPGAIQSQVIHQRHVGFIEDIHRSLRDGIVLESFSVNRAKFRTLGDVEYAVIMPLLLTVFYFGTDIILRAFLSLLAALIWTTWHGGVSVWGPFDKWMRDPRAHYQQECLNDFLGTLDKFYEELDAGADVLNSDLSNWEVMQNTIRGFISRPDYDPTPARGGL